MKLISWNIRGLNSPRKVRLLKNMLMQEKPNILFVQETKCSMQALEKIAIKVWPRGQVTAVDAQGASGGLAILWDSRVIQLSNIHANKNFMQATFHLIDTNTHGHLTNLYFPQDSHQKAEILDHLSTLNSNRLHPLWIAGGDFNMIVRMEEKQGGRDNGIRDGHLLKDFIQSNWLIDLQSNNGLFTWTNKRDGIQHIASRLDRFLVSDNAPYLGGDIITSILPISASDHWPIALQWHQRGNSTKRPFRFDNFWLTHPDFKDFVRQTWVKYKPTRESKMANFQKKLKFLKKEIKHWNHTTFGNIFKAQDVLNQEMKSIQQRIITEGRSEELAKQEQDIEEQILNRAQEEEILWRQKSRIRWLRAGEKNTKFFHKTTVQRRMHKLISHIHNDQGERIETHAGIEENFLRYFKKVHKEPSINRTPAIEKILQQIPKLITDEHNLLLLQPILLYEVDNEVNQLKAGKAPGPDGFTLDFFHHFWDLIQIEVWQLVEESRALRWMYQGLNATFLALIPKSKEANTPDKYLLISLCNIIYKIVSKVIATRLKPLLPLIISPEKSGYVEGRQITDGIILTHEIIHSLKHTKKPSMLLKINLSKSFDNISWQYIQKILIAFGFDPSWTRWILSLLTSTFFSVLINGIPSDTFRPSRGIRQGDPLCPFLFVIIAEGLGCFLKSANINRHLKGLSFNDSPSFTHHQFVDDNMPYGHPSVQDARIFRDILSSFSDASGALINRVKSQIFFFNTPVSTQRSIARILGFTIANLPSKYLGAPLISSVLKQSSWKYLLEKLEAKLFLWTHRALNLANRVILIKAVLQSMPLYLFSLLAVPKWVLKAIRNLQRNFLWGSSGLNRKWALVKWERVYLPKKDGGIGIRDPEHSNTVMGANYGGNGWLTQLLHGPPCGRLNMQHSFWEIKSGDTARFWDDSWQQLPKIADLMQDFPIPPQRPQPPKKVNQFWDTSSAHKYRKWKRIDHIIREEEYEATRPKLADELKKRQIPIAAGANILRWGYEEKGTFSAREAYKIITNDKIIKDNLWDSIWSPSLWPKVSTFLWLLSHNRILTWDNLQKRSFSGPSIYPNCKQAEETTTHLLQTLFKGQTQTLEQIWTILHKNIKESLSIQEWAAEEFPTDPQEKSIWDNWQISLSPNPNASKRLPNRLKKSTVWSPPSRNVFQLNFDGASKGNPGQSGYGGVFRDFQGTPHLIYTGTKGWDTNNSAELEGLWQGLILAKDHNLFPLIIEGYSQIIINMATKLLQGAPIHKVSNSWRMAQILELLRNWLSQNPAISFQHIVREGNKLADFLANVGVDLEIDHYSGPTLTIVTEEQLKEFKNLVEQDQPHSQAVHPDAGVSSSID
eukprot:PITA_08572